MQIIMELILKNHYSIYKQCYLNYISSSYDHSAELDVSHEKGFANSFD